MPDEKTVTMIFPKTVKVQTDEGVKEFTAGTQEIPASLADHWFLKAMGVTKYEPGKAPDGKSGPEEAKPAKRMATVHEVQFLNARGYHGVDSVEQAQEFIDNLQPEHVEEFWKQADAWEPAKEEAVKEPDKNPEPAQADEPEHNVPSKHTTTAKKK